jgi:hypothetical protein
MEFLTRLFPRVRRLERDALRNRSEREEWRQRYTSLHARTQQSDSTATPASDPGWRKRIALWAAEQARALPGDFVECGLQGGCVTAGILESLHGAGPAKTFYLLTDNEADDFEPVSAFPNVRIIRDSITSALPRVTSPQIALLSIATSSPAPAEHLWPRLVPGAIVLLNQHSQPSRTWDAFAAQHSAPILALPTGQGIMVKR